MSVETSFRFTKDGKLWRDDINTREVTITPAIVHSICADMSLRVKNVISSYKWIELNACVDSSGTNWWTAILPQLSIRCPWSMVANKWVPSLDDTSEPVSILNWTPPTGMVLAFLVPIKYNPGEAQMEKAGHSYLFAMSKGVETYRLPLGNLYDECRICLGSERFSDRTQIGCLEKVLYQFQNSQWNNDLWHTQRQTQSLFAYEPSNDGFKQIPLSGAWEAQCIKVGNTISEKITL